MMVWEEGSLSRTTENCPLESRSRECSRDLMESQELYDSPPLSSPEPGYVFETCGPDDRKIDSGSIGLRALL